MLFFFFSPPPSKNLRQLRVDLQKLGTELQSGERACCRNTGGERLRHAISSADELLAKQVGLWRQERRYAFSVWLIWLQFCLFNMFDFTIKKKN